MQSVNWEKVCEKLSEWSTEKLDETLSTLAIVLTMRKISVSLLAMPAEHFNFRILLRLPVQKFYFKTPVSRDAGKPSDSQINLFSLSEEIVYAINRILDDRIMQEQVFRPVFSKIKRKSGSELLAEIESLLKGAPASVSEEIDIDQEVFENLKPFLESALNELLSFIVARLKELEQVSRQESLSSV